MDSQMKGDVRSLSERELVMSRKPQHPLRPLTEMEERALHRIEKATSERHDVVQRAKAIRLVHEGKMYTEVAHEAGYHNSDSIRWLIQRFNQSGLAALLIAPGRGRKPTYTSEQQVAVLTEVQREPHREQDQAATWSLTLLQQRLRHTQLPRISRETIRRTLHAAGYTWQRTRTWIPTGTALRRRKSGTV